LHFPDCKGLVPILGGLVPTDTAAELVGVGAMVVADAVGLANPITGGGIVFALASGKLAGRVAAESIRAGQTGRNGLQRYSRECRETPNCVWLRCMGLLRARLERKAPDEQPVAYLRMLRGYLSFLHRARFLVDMTLRSRRR
jgi:flavin-dependent dehydrogenase